jgi:hypothetical protein
MDCIRLSPHASSSPGIGRDDDLNAENPSCLPVNLAADQKRSGKPSLAAIMRDSRPPEKPE